MKKKNGFTLIELLAVISILALILVITIPIVMNLLNDDKKITEAVNSSLVKASGIYVTEFTDEIDWYIHKNDYKDACIDLSALADKGYVKDKNVNIDDIRNEYSVRVTVDPEGAYSYDVIKTSKCVFDDTVPHGYFGNVRWTSKSVSIDLVCTEDDSKVKGIEYYDLNDDKWKTINVDLNAVVSRTFNFNNLKNNKSYQISFKCLNTADMVGDEINQTIDLAQLSMPTISLNTSNWSKEKYATINFDPTIEDHQFFYQLDGNGWVNIDDSSEFEKINDGIYRYRFVTSGHTLVAKNFDGVNESTYASLAVNKIDTDVPTCVVKKNNFTSSGVNVSVVSTDTGGSGFGSSNISNKTDNYTGLKTSNTYTIRDEAGNTNSCDVQVSSKIQKKSCNSCSTCSTGNCAEYNSCSNSSCGCSQYSSCSNSACGCSQYNSCSNSACGKNYSYSCIVTYSTTRGSTYTYINGCTLTSSNSCYSTSTTYDARCTSPPCTYPSGCKRVEHDRGYKSCRTSACGCSSYNTCTTSACGCSTYNTCSSSSCGCRRYSTTTSCSTCGCSSWSDWTDVSSCSSNSSTSCQTLYY